MLAVPTKSAKIKDCHPKCLGKYRSRPRCNVKRLFAPKSHLAKLKIREVANITHRQHYNAAVRCQLSGADPIWEGTNVGGRTFRGILDGNLFLRTLLADAANISALPNLVGSKFSPREA